MKTLAALMLTGFLAFSGIAFAGEIRPSLQEAMAAAEPGERIPVSIILADQVPRQEIVDIVAANKSKDARRRLIRSRLKQHALNGQKPLLAFVSQGEDVGKVAHIRTLWLSSVIAAELTTDLIRAVAERDDVAWINHNPKQDVFLGLSPSDASITAGTPTCGNDLIGATQVGADMGITGRGVVVALIDTGVCYFHPDITNQIWINPGEDLDGDGRVMDPDDENGIDDDSNGFVDDLIGWSFDAEDNNPIDYMFHGSHTAGTVAGDGTSGTQAGAAPGAQIMVLRVGNAAVDEMDVWLSMEYAVDNGADLISLSMGWAPEHLPDRATWRLNCDNTIDMGVTMVTSAGNEGAGNPPIDVTTPGDVPRIISVGAVDCSDQLASFSSVGPTSWQDIAPYNDHPYPPGLIKPDIAAPGVNTTSHNHCGGYRDVSGTSMSCPHVAGVIALMLETDPTLEHDQIKQLLESTAVDLGAPGKDNEYGSGRVDAVAAVSAVASPLRYESHVFDDTNPVHGDGDGELDTGEIASLVVTLVNAGDNAAIGVRARIISSSPGVEVLNPVAYYPDLQPATSAASIGSPFSVRLDQGCGQLLRFDLEIDQETGPMSYSGFSFDTGVAETFVLFEDDMETDTGWTVSGTETENSFVREDPYEVDISGEIIQPEDDNTPGAAYLAWITGNDEPRGGFKPEDGDVDGLAILSSPLIDATEAYDGVTLELYRWFHKVSEGSGDTSRGEIRISDDAGSTDKLIIRDNDSTNGWEPFSERLSLRATSQVQLNVTAEERWIGIPSGEDSNVEMLVDDVRFTGNRYVCGEFTAPPALAPNAIGNSLLLSREYGDVRLNWAVPVVDGSHDAAALYQVYSSAAAGSGFVQDFETTATHRIDSRMTASGQLVYFLVAASNSGGTSGEEPAP